MLASMRRYADSAVDRFIRRRTPPRRLPIVVSPRRLYILPTRNGGIFALLLLVMLLGATNYGNSLGFALTFWLAAVALVSMHHAHRNLVGVQISRIRARPVFAGNAARFDITLLNPSRARRRGLHLRASQVHSGERVDLPTDTPVTVTVLIPAEVRGQLSCPRLCVESVYPMGLFRAWSWLQPHTRALVYPRCAGDPNWPQTIGATQHTERLRRRGQEEFLGHRDHRPGDSSRHIDWKASARSDALLVREYADQGGRTIWLDYENTPGADRESRISQLALWVVTGDRAGVSYGLRLPTTELSPDRGRGHRHACLRALALL